MPSRFLAGFFALVCLAITCSTVASAFPAKQAAVSAYDRLPLSFEPNVGQVNRRAQFLCRGTGYSLFLMPTGAVMAMQHTSTSPTLEKRRGHCLPDAHRSQMAQARPQGVALSMILLGANPQAKGIGENKQPGVVSYFVGKDSSKWHSGIATFGQVRYQNVYPGVDLLYYGNNHQLEYDLIIKPGGDYHRATLQFAGAQSVQVDKAGNLILSLSGGETVWKRPVAYQVDAEGRKQWIASRYSLDSKSKTARFVVGRYDRSRTLVLDPGLIYSTYLGGSSKSIYGDSGSGIAVDSTGNAYVMGYTDSSDFPTTVGAFQTTYSGVFITKLSPDGASLIYSTYLGGSGGDGGDGIAIDSAGNAYITGVAYSHDFPITPDAFQTTNKGHYGNAFITKLSADGGELIYSTYLGGSGGFIGGDFGIGIAVDGAGSAYITGGTASRDFPITAGAFQMTNEGYYVNAFVTKLSVDGKTLVYSTYLGGKGNTNGGGDVGTAIAIDKSGNAYVTGSTASLNFPVTPGAFQKINRAAAVLYDESAFVTKLSADGKSLIYSTYLGGSGDSTRVFGDGASGIAIDSAGNAYITGSTYSLDFPTTTGTFQRINKAAANAASNAFVTKLSPDGKSLIYSTYLGGSGYPIGVTTNVGSSGNIGYRYGDGSSGIAVDSEGNAYVTGSAYSKDFPTTVGAFQTVNQGALNQATNAFMTKLSANGKSLLYSTYLGGSGDNRIKNDDDYGTAIAINSTGVAYVTGRTDSADFPVIPGAFQATNKAAATNGTNAFVSKLDTLPLSLTDLTITPNPVLGGQQNATGTLALSEAAPAGGADVLLTSANTGAATVPASVTVSAGATKANFPITTKKVPVSVSTRLTATYNGSKQQIVLTVTAVPILLTGLSVAPNPALGGQQNPVGTITLSNPAPTGGSVVSLSSANTGAATVPASVTVPAGAISATFTVTTKKVPSNVTTRISASYNRSNQSAVLTVTH